MSAGQLTAKERRQLLLTVIEAGARDEYDGWAPFTIANLTAAVGYTTGSADGRSRTISRDVGQLLLEGKLERFVEPRTEERFYRVVTG